MDLVGVKGDMNYRRLLGDLRWSLSTPFNSVVQYFPAPLLALRVLKAELATDMDPSRVASLNRLDPEWLTNGRWGVIQFSPSA
jgi:Damage-control phosphatase ARMT1-like domain